MTPYRAYFYAIDGLAEVQIDPAYGLAATDRAEAEAEALRLPAPDGANTIRLFREGRYEAPQIGFAL